jgi:hypothetical protein
MRLCTLLAVVAFLLIGIVSPGTVTAGPTQATFVRQNSEIQIPQIAVLQGVPEYTISSGTLLYSANGISVIAIEDKMLAENEGVKTYYVDFIASRLFTPQESPIYWEDNPTVRWTTFADSFIDQYIPVGPAPEALQAILTVSPPDLEENIFTENTLAGFESATEGDVLKQFAIWAYMGVDYASLQGAWVFAGLNAQAWEEAEVWFASFAKASSAENLEELDNSISVSFEAQGYSEVVIDLVNHRENYAYVRVEAGTILKNQNGSNQNISIGETGAVLVPAGMSKEVILNTYCINLHRGVPSGSDMLAPSAERNGDLLKLFQNAAGKGYSQGAIQEAVWHLTDGAGVYSHEAQELLADSPGEFKTWDDIDAAAWNPQESPQESSPVIELVIASLVYIGVVITFTVAITISRK